MILSVKVGEKPEEHKIPKCGFFDWLTARGRAKIRAERDRNNQETLRLITELSNSWPAMTESNKWLWWKAKPELVEVIEQVIRHRKQDLAA